MKHLQDDGTEIDVFTTEEVAARETAAREAAAGEFAPKLTEAQKEIERVNNLLNDRTREFGQFRELNAEQLAKLSATERDLYENQKLLIEERAKNAESDKKAYTNAVTAAIRTKVGTDQKLFDKVKGLYDVIGLDDSTGEGIAQRVAAAIGALGGTEPDLLASAGFSVGAVEPPKAKDEGEKTFADSERGKAGAAELGLKVDYTAEEKKRLGIA